MFTFVYKEKFNKLPNKKAARVCQTFLFKISAAKNSGSKLRTNILF